MLHLKRLICYPIPLIPLLFLLGLFVNSTPLRAQSCASMTVTWDNWEPCKFRVVLNNSTECVPSLRLLLNSGQFAGWSASTANGWTGQLIAPNEIILTHTNGFVPIGQSIPVGFSLAPGVVADAALLWDFTCGLGEGCFSETTLTSCPDPDNASITGVKYVECDAKAYLNQPVVPGWPIQLLNMDGVVIAEEQTGSDGRYAFYDLPYGVYLVKELAALGWTSSVPASGQITVDLAPSGQGTANFGNCPACSCDSVFMDVVQLPVTSDSCRYRLAVQNSSAFCFSQYDVTLTTGQFTAYTVTAAGWVVVPVSGQHLQLTAPAGTMTPAGNIFPLDFSITGNSVHDIRVSTISGAGIVCFRSFSYPCPPPAIPAPCCPQGSTFGPELVVNGDFQAGNTGFTSGYSPNYFIPGTNTMIGWYSVLQSNQVYAANSQWSAIEHTAWQATGKMLIVDGNNFGSNVAWREMVNVTAGTNYAFSAWVNNLVIPTRNYADPGAQLWVNGVNVASVATLSEMPDQWVRLCGTWTATVSGLVNIEIRMANTTSVGNDLAVDDVSFRACVPPPPCQVSINVTPINNCGLVQVSATVGTGQVATYQWCDGQTTASYTVQLPCGPHTFCVTATCANGSTSTAVATYVASDNVPPVALCQSVITATLTPNCVANITSGMVNAGSSDNCQILSLQVSPAQITGCGTTQVILTVTDWCNNTSTCATSVQTTENIPPDITCPPTVTILGTLGAAGGCVAMYQPGTPTATDNCDPSVTITGTAPTVFGAGTTSVVWTATDDCGNTQTCSQQIVVQCCANCPTGSTPGPELVTNGDFQAGNTGFSSNYIALPPTCSPNEYTVASGITVPTLCNNWTATDHTTGLNTGLMYVADGSMTPGVAAWYTPVTLTANTVYSLCAFANNLNEPSFDRPDPIVEAIIMDATLTTVIATLSSTGLLPETPDVWFDMSTTWTSSVSGAYNLVFRTAGTSFEGNNFALDDISFRACVPPPVCTCGVYSDMTYRPAQGTMNIPVMCGDSLFADCTTTFPWTLNGVFMCQGNNCPPVTNMFWTLKDPVNAPIASNPTMTANPNFSLNINSSLFATAGVYTLTIGAICGTDTCYCIYYIHSNGCGCCASYDEFCQNLMNHIVTSVDADLCKATVTISNLPNCDRVDWINWGDGNQTGGPFVAGSMAMHTYSGSGGTFVISYLAIETNPQTGLICFEKVVHDTIVLQCDSCATPPSGMVAWWPMDDQLGDAAAVDTIGVFDALPMSGGSIGFSAGPDPVPGKVGGALEFAGTPTYAFLEVVDDPALNFGAGNFTIDAWVNTNMSTQTEPIVDKLGNTNTGYGLSIQGASPYYLTLAIGNGSSVQYLNGPQVLPGQWTFVAAVVNGGTADLYVGYGGTLYQVTGLPITGTANASNTLPLLIGKNPLNPHWNITIDELEIFDTAVPFADLKAIFEADSIGKCKPATSSVWTPTGRGLQKMQIFPNPASGVFNVAWTFESQEHSTVRLVNINGEVVLEKAVAEGQLNTQIQAGTLSVGMYFVQFITEGRVISVGKVVKY